MAADKALPQVVKKTIEQAIRLLDATGSQYKVIAIDGTEFGKLAVVTPKKRRINNDREYGAIRKYYDKFVKYDAEVGEVFEIPLTKEFKAEEIRSGVCAKLSTRWGTGTSTTAITGDKVQILRTA
jgi:hypothetical protein